MTHLVVDPVLAEVATPVAGPAAVQPRVAAAAINLWIYVRWIYCMINIIIFSSCLMAVGFLLLIHFSFAFAQEFSSSLVIRKS